MEPEEVGGGMVDRVLEDQYMVKEKFPDREEAGTPNIPGAIALAATIEVLDRIGMDLLMEIEDEIMEYTLTEMREIKNLIVYGGTDFETSPRAASISFNIKGLNHGIVAAVLNDYFNIAVRNQCFCAHPYVKELMIEDLEKEFGEIDFGNMDDEFMRKAGMVRASFGMYSSMDDARALIAALKDISANGAKYAELYEVNPANDYEHNHYKPKHDGVFSVRSALDSYLNDL